MSDHDIRAMVRDRYGSIATANGGCCTPAPQASGCCGSAAPSADELARRMGYGDDERAAIPDGANLGLGCGNPQAIAALQPGEVVLDLGSGAGFDCFLAARAIGPQGRVIGVDMTHEMLAKARANAAALAFGTVEFRLGEIEHLPVADNSVDVVISNCVLNLSPAKAQVLREAFRVLRPGGRVAISDLVMLAPLPDHLARDAALYAGCIAGAATRDELLTWLAEAGFTDISVEPKPGSADLIRDWVPGSGAENHVASAVIAARKPGRVA
jgi:arsenite methyltransferase